jgi:hypothetical protein
VTQNVAPDGKLAEFRSAWERSMPVESEKRKARLNRRLELLSVIALAAIYLVWFAWPLFWSASENVRLVGAFNTDEEAHVMLLKEAIDSRFPRLGYIQYGYAYLNMGLLPLFILSYFTEVSEQQIIVWLRMIPTLFAIATVALTFLMTRRYFGRLAAWLSTFLLSFTVLNFLEMSAMSHSDIPQVFFLMLSIYFCCRLAEDGRLKWLIWASVAAGFAFGCKYSGLFLLPIIGLYGILQTIRSDATQVRVNSDRVVKVSRLLVMLAGVGLLILGFVVIPYVAAPYIGAEYFGISMPQFFDSLRVLAIAAGVGLVLLAVVPFVWTFVRPRPKLTYLLKLGMLSAITFAVAFFITSPFNVFSVRSGFLRGFFYESLHSSFGHAFEAENGKLQWMSILSSPELLDPFILGLAVISLVVVVCKVAKGSWQQLLGPESVMWVWTLFYFVFLVWRVNIRTHRALLPIIPFLLMFAAHAVSQVVQYVATRTSRRLVATLTTAGLLVIVGFELSRSLERIIEFRRATSQREQTSDAVLAGHWLAEHYPPSARILYDPYSYVPPLFSDAHVTPWGGTLQMLETLEPDVVIINEYNSSLFSDIRQAATYVRDEAHFIAKYEYYETLRKEKAGYIFTRDFGDVRVYVRQ